MTRPIPPGRKNRPRSDGGLNFASEIGERCAFLGRKTFESLPRGGRIVIREILFNNDRADGKALIRRGLG
jgi:hypothetical protein